MTSPPPSPAMPKYKLAEYRYGREEMLALYIKDNKVRLKSLPKLFARKFLSPLKSDLCFFRPSIFRSQRTCRIRSLLLFCKMSPCSHWHSCLSPRKSRSVENMFSGASGYLRARFTRAGQDLCSKNTFCRLTKRVPHIPALFALSILCLRFPEEFLYVCEQRGGAEAHGKGSGRGSARRGG